LGQILSIAGPCRDPAQGLPALGFEKKSAHRNKQGNGSHKRQAAFHKTAGCVFRNSAIPAQVYLFMIWLAQSGIENSLLPMSTTLSPVAYDAKIEGNVIFTQVDAAINWMRSNSLWPMPMGLACCAIELMAASSSRFDISRFGAEVMRFSPRQADVMIVAGTVTYKMALAVKRIWDQMPEPKWCIAMGACASSGGMYRSYAVLQGIDHLIPVDVYISGCPPRPEALLDGLMRLQKKIMGEHALVDQKKELLETL